MCLLVVAWRVHPRYPLIVGANRDEFHRRPAAPLGRWPDRNIFGGRDLQAGGTWLAVDEQRRFGVVTNFRDLQPPRPGAPSRGSLIPAYHERDLPPGEFLAGIEAGAAAYGGFNLLLSDGKELWYACNRDEPFARALPPGIHGLSNHFLNTPWPKLQRVRHRLQEWLTGAGERLAPEPLFELLADRRPALDDEALPQTGLDPAWERTLSAPFVVHPLYGTRCTTVVLLDAAGNLFLGERRFDSKGRLIGESLLTLVSLPSSGTEPASQSDHSTIRGAAVMAKYGKRAQKKVARAMRERKQGKLRMGRSGKKVRSRKQAIAIGLSEARREGAKVPPASKKKKKKAPGRRGPARKAAKKK